jgi:predicted metal-binding membrane protein
MRLSRNNRIKINFVIIGISILVWVLLLINPGHIMTIEHCHVSASGPSTASLQMLLEMNPFSSQLIGWGLMVVAMMLPKLISPIQSIYIQSFKRYRFLNALLFVLGYIIVWMVAGVFMIGVIIGLNLLMPMSYIPALGVFIIAVVWQFSPIKQQFLNLGHDHRTLSAFGWASFRDSLHFGVMHGVWCVGAGWALMLFPMLLPQGHNLAMIIVTFIMISEHMEHPRFPQWHFNLRLKLLRIIVAQTRIKLIPFSTT